MGVYGLLGEASWSYSDAIRASFVTTLSKVGYCQGLSFVVAVLLLHLEETEAFALFSVIMSEYQFRDLFKKGFQMLQLKFYILEK